MDNWGHKDELLLKQDFVAKMLAVRRSGVAGALASLQATEAISQRRGRIPVCDQPDLVVAACGCYGHVQAFAAAVAAWNLDTLNLAA